MGAVEILIVYENLDTMRYILRLHGAEQLNNGPENGTDQTMLKNDNKMNTETTLGTTLSLCNPPV